MSKLLTQEELAQIYQDFFHIQGSLKLFGHIDALTEELSALEKHRDQWAKRDIEQRREIARRDALAGEPSFWGNEESLRFITNTIKQRWEKGEGLGGLINQQNEYSLPLYAAPPAPVSGIDANHVDPDLLPGEYSVNISTPGGAAIINGTQVAPVVPDECVGEVIEKPCKGKLGEGSFYKQILGFNKMLECPIGTKFYTSTGNVYIPNKISSIDAPTIKEINEGVIALSLHGAYGVYAFGWNAYRAAMLAKQPVSAAIRDIIAERQRQIAAEGWTPEHDDQYKRGELELAAACYAAHGYDGFSEYGYEPDLWPWASEWWKPTTPRRDLIKAGALILAEIERVDRANGDKGAK